MVSLDNFRARAAIDFITIGHRAELMLPNTTDVQDHLADIFTGGVELPGRFPRSSLEAWLTIHNPTRADLQLLIDDLPTAQILKLEIAVDFIPERTADKSANEELYRWLRHSVAPQNHTGAEKLVRKQYDVRTGVYQRLERHAPLNECTSFLWCAKSGFQVRLYIKEFDDARRKRLTVPVVRLEGTLDGSGMQAVGAHRVGLLSEFVPEIRRVFSPLLSVGDGFRSSSQLPRSDRIRDPRRRAVAEAARQRLMARHTRFWNAYGAAFGLRNDLPVHPDRDANRVIERALKNLGDRLRGLRQPEKVADFRSWKAKELSMYDLFSEGVPKSFRRTSTAGYRSGVPSNKYSGPA